MVSGERPIVVLISANAEWRSVLTYYAQPDLQLSPFGGFFQFSSAGQKVIFVKSGWGKISAAASTQYAIQTFQPRLLINLGTCGGIAGMINTGEVLLAEETLVYDIFERMGDAVLALDHYRARLDLSFLREPYPQPVKRGRILSADQDIDPALVPELVSRHQAVVADWESGAIAWTAVQNNVPCLILRGVTDLVSPQAGEIYDDLGQFRTRAEAVMQTLLDALPGWIACSLDAFPQT